MEELAEWAQRESLGLKFRAGLDTIVARGGLRTVKDEFLQEELGIRLQVQRKRILDAIKRKLGGKKKVAFGEVVEFEATLAKKPKFTQCIWVDLDEIQAGHDEATLQAAMRTWRFCTSGVDGLEDVSLVQDVFNAWKPKPKAWNCVVGWILSIHLLIHWVFHDSSFPGLRDILDAASIQTPIRFSSKDFWGTPSRSQVCHEDVSSTIPL